MAFAIRNAENKHDVEAEVLERHYAVSIQHAGRDKITLVKNSCKMKNS